MSSQWPVLAACLVQPATDPIGTATCRVQTELPTVDHFAPRSLRRPRSSSAEAAEGHLETPPISGPADIARTANPPGDGAVALGAAGKAGASPRLYCALRCDPRDHASQILLETERLLRICGHRKTRVADVADACGFSAANVYRYFSSRRAILDALASHYLRETERAALARAICDSYSARDRLSGFLTGLNTALITFSDCEPRVSELLADAAAEQWPCYTRHDAQVILHIAKILTEASASGEFRFGADAEQEARRVKAAACALVEPDVILSCRDRYDVSTREAVSRLIAAAPSNQSVSPSRTSRDAD